jgi:hypothetical protein
MDLPVKYKHSQGLVTGNIQLDFQDRGVWVMHRRNWLMGSKCDERVTKSSQFGFGGLAGCAVLLLVRRVRWWSKN